MLSPSAPQGPLRGWLKGHFPLNTLQDKVPVYPMLSGKAHISFRQLDPVAKTWLCLAEGMCQGGSEREPPGCHPGWQPALVTV